MSVVNVPLVKAYTTITFTGVAVADETLIIGDKTYTFKVAPSAAYEVDIKTDETTQAAAIVSAINLDGTAGAYGASHVEANPYVQATSADGVITITARHGGTQANAIALEMTATNGTNIAAGTALSASAGASAGTGSLESWITAALSGLVDPKSKTISLLKELT
jgi:hypothetical protein